MDNLFKQKICVTGGSGALGRSLVAKLLEYGAKDIVIFDKRIHSSKNKIAAVTYIEGSILNKANLKKALKGCNVIFHLAALTNAGQSAAEPERYMQTNCIGTMKVLEVCRELKVLKIIYPSTSHVYGYPETIPVNEKHPVKPLSVYAASKLTGEAMIYGYSASFGISSVIARLPNLYSIASGPETVVGLALEQVISGNPIHLRNLLDIRDFLYIEDASEGLIRLAQTQSGNSGTIVVNVSNSKGMSVGEICDILAESALENGLKKPEIIRNPSNTHGKGTAFYLDNALLKKFTGWSPQTPMKQGLSDILKQRLQ